MAAVETIEVECAAACILCGNEGKALYRGLRDGLFGAPGVWGFDRCPGCGLAWLNPRPLPDEVAKAYLNYSTHAPQKPPPWRTLWRKKVQLALYSSQPGFEDLVEYARWKRLGRVLSFVPALREIGSLGTMCLSGMTKGKLLDVGCGAGEFLALMLKAGWDVQGVEPDPLAAESARQKVGQRVYCGDLFQVELAREEFDAITAHHVLEHVFDPVRFLQRCGELLKPNGQLVLITPNVESMGHKRFGQAWRGLEPPRHIHLFSLPTLREVAIRSGLGITLLRTSSRSAHWIWVASDAIRNGGGSRTTWWKRLLGLAFQAREEKARRKGLEVSEELLLVASRRG